MIRVMIRVRVGIRVRVRIRGTVRIGLGLGVEQKRQALFAPKDCARACVCGRLELGFG